MSSPKPTRDFYRMLATHLDMEVKATMVEMAKTMGGEKKWKGGEEQGHGWSKR